MSNGKVQVSNQILKLKVQTDVIFKSLNGIDYQHSLKTEEFN
jgi:hypothetical protein